ncbi:MAG TPA: sialidase family protein [Candidatus Thermoplasmatota archaeon]|nr:sialidase family protein [Candidatus Thermoplasmatota archaeon]
MLLQGCDAPIFPGIRGREVDVAVDPNDRSRVAAAAMVSIPSTRGESRGADLAVWTGVARSSDGGRTWQTMDLPNYPGDTEHPAGPFTGAAVLGDPIVGFLPNGDLLLSAIYVVGGAQYNMFTARFRGDSMEMTDVVTFSRGGWGDPALNDVPGVNPVAYNDKQDIAIDPETGGLYVSWMWRSNLRGTTSVPVVSYSPDGGLTWEGPVTLVDALGAGLTSDDAHIGAAPFLLADEVHVVWLRQGTDSLWMASAPRGTLDFGEPREIAKTGGSAGSGNSVLTSSLPQLAVGPRSDGTGQRVWMAAVIAGDGYDIGLWHSDDAQTWVGPVVPYPRTAQDQLHPAVALDETGHLAVQYIDRSDDPDNAVYNAVVSLSDDDGATFRQVRMSSEPSNAFQTGDKAQGHVGDYFGNAITSEGALGAWQDGREGTAENGYSEVYGCVVPLDV